MNLLRQIGFAITAFIVFAAIITALSALLKMPGLPVYIETGSRGLSNLFYGTFGITPSTTSVRRVTR